MKRLLLLASLAVSTFCTMAQDLASQRSVMVTAEAIEKPFPKIKLIWNDDFNASKWTVYRKDTNGVFQSIAVVNSPDTSYLDEDVNAEKPYTYLIHKENINEVLGFGTITAGLRSKATHSYGTALILVEDLVYQSLESEIEQYRTDLRMEGWRTLVEKPSATASHIDLKKLIVEHYTKSDSTLTSVILIGNLAVPYSGQIAPDGHYDEHAGAWPADVYYGDIDGVWTDAVINNKTAVRKENHNSPGDGKFDESNLPSDVELMVGRIYLERFEAFETDRMKLYRRYLNRNHDFKTAQFRFDNQAIINNDFKGLEEGFAGIGYRSFPAIVGRENVSHGRLLDNARDTSYLMAYGCGNGDYYRAGSKLRNEKGKRVDSFTVSETSDYFNYSINCGINILFGSFFGDWDSENNLLRAPLAGKSPALATFWAGRPVWHLNEFSHGLPIGFSARTTQNSDIYLFHEIEGSRRTYERLIHVALMGDPTLHMHYRTGVKNVVAQAIEGRKMASLKWDGPVEAIGYYVYRRDTVKDIYELLNPTIITSNSFVDSFPNEGTNEYMVRAAYIHSSPSGSYEQLALGETARVTGIKGLSKGYVYSERAVQIFPNPASKTVFIQSETPIIEGEIINLEGRVLTSFGTVINQKNLNISGLASGSYFIRTTTQHGTNMSRLQVR